MRGGVGLLILLLGAVAQAAPARADSRLLEEAVGLAGAAMWLTSGAPGLVLAVVRGPDALVRGYGETAEGNGQEPDGRSLLRLGSITKVFTTEVLAGLAADGKLRLTDALAAHAPAGASVPPAGDRPITLLDLATHSAGLPREMGNAPEGAPPFTWPTQADRWAWLGKHTLGWPPGTVAAYSNVGFDLLADALGDAAGEPYPVLLRDRVTGPLGMGDTAYQPTPEQCGRLMTGSGIGGPGPCVDSSATAGAGGLYSTGDDMLIWLRHQMGDPHAWAMRALAHAVYRSRQSLPAAIGFDEAGAMDGIALGWLIVAAHDQVPMLIAKSGGGGGFMTYVAFAPGRDVGVFVAVSRLDFGMYAGLVTAANGIIAGLASR